jgi:hypothetical protein
LSWRSAIGSKIGDGLEKELGTKAEIRDVDGGIVK